MKIKTSSLFLSIFLLIFFNCQFTIAQENDWQLPMVKDKIVFDFTSPIIPGKVDMCEIYTSPDFLATIMSKCNNIYLNSVANRKLYKSKKAQVIPTLYGATGGFVAMPNCNKSKNDTLTGSLRIVQENQSFFTGVKGGAITCMYRIILYNDKINVKFKGFELTASKDRNGGYAIAPEAGGRMGAVQSLETEVRPLEEEYKNMQSKKADQEFWLDFKNLIGEFYKILESEITRRRGGVDFDD